MLAWLPPSAANYQSYPCCPTGQDFRNCPSSPKRSVELQKSSPTSDPMLQLLQQQPLNSTIDVAKTIHETSSEVAASTDSVESALALVLCFPTSAFCWPVPVKEKSAPDVAAESSRWTRKIVPANASRSQQRQMTTSFAKPFAARFLVLAAALWQTPSSSDLCARL